MSLSWGCGDMDMAGEPGGCDANCSEPSAPDAAPEVPDGGIELPPLGPGVATLSGSDEPGSADGARGQALFNNPVNVAVSSAGVVYVADFDNHLIRRVTADGAVATVALDQSGFARPFGLAFSNNGLLYIQTDYNSSGLPGGALWVLDPGTDDIQLVVDDIGKTRGLTALPDGRVIGASMTDHVIWLIEPVTGTVSPIAGAAGQAGYVDGPGGQARFDSPSGVLLIAPDAVLVADRGNHRLRKVTLTGEVTTVAGTGEAATIDGGPGEAAFNAPQGLAMDSEGVIYISSLGGYVIRRMIGDVVDTVAGDGAPGYRDDPDDPLAAQFFGLEGMDVSVAGDYLYVADGNRGGEGAFHRLRRIALPPARGAGAR